MTREELWQALAAICGGGDLQYDNYGQAIFYTNLMDNEDRTELVPFVHPDDQT